MTIEQLLQWKSEGDDFESVLQAKEKRINALQVKLQAQEVQVIELQAKKESSDIATQFSYLDIAECKSTIFHALKYQ